jgi:arabinofuranosyltransferase
VLPVLLVVPWAVTAARDYRPPYFAKGNGVGPQGIADERTFYVQFAGYHPHPITLADYAAGVWPRDGHALRAVADAAAQSGERILFPTKDWLVERDVAEPHGGAEDAEGVRRGHVEGPNPSPPQLALAPSNPQWLDPRTRVVAHRNNVGLTGYAAGPTVHLVDHLGLADPLASRLRLERRQRPGHEKDLPDDWVLARFGPTGLASQTSAAVDAAHRALTCPASDLAMLLDAITQPLTWPRFWQNVALSSRLTQLRFSADPVQAMAEVCRG